MRNRLLTLGTAMVAGAALLAGCGGSSGSSSTNGGASSTTAVNTKVDGTGKTLTLWDYEGDNSAMGIAWNAAIKQFETETGEIGRAHV